MTDPVRFCERCGIVLYPGDNGYDKGLCQDIKRCEKELWQIHINEGPWDHIDFDDEEEELE